MTTSAWPGTTGITWWIHPPNKIVLYDTPNYLVISGNDWKNDKKSWRRYYLHLKNINTIVRAKTALKRRVRSGSWLGTSLNLTEWPLRVIKKTGKSRTKNKRPGWLHKGITSPIRLEADQKCLIKTPDDLQTSPKCNERSSSPRSFPVGN